MGKKLTAEEKEFVAKVAKNSYDMIIDVQEIKKAFKLLTDQDLANIRTMRMEMFNYHTKPELYEDKKDALPIPDKLKKRMEEEAKGITNPAVLDNSGNDNSSNDNDHVNPLEREPIGLDNLKIDKIEILDILGKTVSVKTENTSQIDISHLSNGIYIFKIYSGETVSIKKIIKE